MENKKLTKEQVLDKVYHEMKSAWSLPPIDSRWRKVALAAMEEWGKLLSSVLKDAVSDTTGA